MAKDHKGSSHAGENQSADHRPAVPPSGAVVNPTIPAPCAQEKPCYTKDASSEEPLPRWRRPEWIIVYVTVIYVIIAGLTLWAIKRQADLMARQNQNMIAKERARIAVVPPEDPFIVRTDKTVIMASFRVQVSNFGETVAMNLFGAYESFASDEEPHRNPANLFPMVLPDVIKGRAEATSNPLHVHPRFADSRAIPHTFHVYIRGVVKYDDLYSANRNPTTFFYRREFQRSGEFEARSFLPWEKCGADEDNRIA